MQENGSPPSDPLIRRHKIMSNFLDMESFFHFHFQVANFEEYK